MGWGGAGARGALPLLSKHPEGAQAHPPAPVRTRAPSHLQMKEAAVRAVNEAKERVKAQQARVGGWGGVCVCGGGG